MKFLVALLLTLMLAFIAGLFLPWWSIALVAFLVATLVIQGPGRAFLAGFFALFMLWGVLAWWIDIKNESILSMKIAELLGVGQPSLLVLLTAVVAALVGGLAAMSGSYFRRLMRNPTN